MQKLWRGQLPVSAPVIKTTELSMRLLLEDFPGEGGGSAARETTQHYPRCAAGGRAHWV
jgi:hypothetical protein